MSSCNDHMKHMCFYQNLIIHYSILHVHLHVVTIFWIMFSIMLTFFCCFFKNSYFCTKIRKTSLSSSSKYPTKEKDVFSIIRII